MRAPVVFFVWMRAMEWQVQQRTGNTSCAELHTQHCYVLIFTSQYIDKIGLRLACLVSQPFEGFHCLSNKGDAVAYVLIL